MTLVSGEPLHRGIEAGVAEQAAAVVVFVGDTELKCLRWLRAGFRHCFVVVRSGGHWVACDPLCHRTLLVVLPPVPRADLMRLYRRRGYHVLATTTMIPPRVVAPVRPFTCVEAVKRILGLRAPWVFTPWQLYCHLLRHRQASFS